MATGPALALTVGVGDEGDGVDDADEETRRFNREIKAIEELERWETRITEIPDISLQDAFLETMGAYSTMRKIGVYKLLALFNWDLKTCDSFNKLLQRVPLDRVDWLIQVMNEYHGEGKLSFSFSFFSLMEQHVLTEIFYVFSREALDRAINIGRFLDTEALSFFVYYINELGVKEVLQIISDCDEPMVKHCRLCRTRRVFNLENRLVHAQVPKGMIRVTGCLAIYDKSEVWSRADEMNFTFDHAKGIIYWNKVVVDMMRICDKCLADSLRAACSDCTDVSFHHLDVEQRKPMLAELRRREQLIGELMYNLAEERVRRRVKEFAVKSLETQRRGLRLERDAEEARMMAALKESKRESDEAAYRVTMKAAMAVNEKWINETLVSENKVLGKKVHLASMNYHPGFTRENPATTTLEHPHSWKHAHFTPDGTPLSPEGALQRYGTYVIATEDRFDQLHEWRNNMTEGQARFEKRLADLAANKREAELKEFADNKEFVDKRLKRLKRKEENVARILELEEQARIDKRKADKLARMLLRVAKIEANERFLMEIEDDHSLKRRFYEVSDRPCYTPLYIFFELSNSYHPFNYPRQFECWREDTEREAMWFEEMEQCSVDNFWGLDHEAALKMAEKEKWIAWYNARVQATREKLIMSRQIRPFRIEAALKLYRDPITKKVLY